MTLTLLNLLFLNYIPSCANLRGGHQAALSRPSGSTSQLTTNPRRSNRGIGIGPNGLVLSLRNRDETDSEDDEGSSREETSEGDLERGLEQHQQLNGRRSRISSSRRNRRGFDRLRESGLSRGEINALRIYFARQIDRFIQQHDLSSASSSTTGSVTVANGDGTAPNIVAHDANNDQWSDDPAEQARFFRLRMEDEWMETQGPYSEFRLNINTSNPLLIGRGGSREWYSRYSMGNSDSDGGGIFLRSSRAIGDGASGNGTAQLSRFNGTSPNISFVGTERDFLWGFFLGFFVGFMMIFWVWLPTVPHKQKMGILSGICFHLLLNLLQQEKYVEDGTLDSPLD